MIKLVPEQYAARLSMAIARGWFDEMKQIIERNAIDVDAFMETKFYTSVIMEAISSVGVANEEDRLKMLLYLLQKGANPNTLCKAGYNCLHVAAQGNRRIKALDLFLDFNGDVNITDSNGANVLYWALFNFGHNLAGGEKQFHLKVIEKILMLGGALDLANRFGMTPRKWLEHRPGEASELVEKCEKLKPVYKPTGTKIPEFPTNLLYPEIATKIWDELVPLYGQADTVQGELLRAVEKLKDEAQRNGNVNFRADHKLLANFLMDVLVCSGIFDKKEVAKIKTESKKVMASGKAYTEDDIYDYITDKVCEFYLAFKEPIAHKKNPAITC